MQDVSKRAIRKSLLTRDLISMVREKTTTLPSLSLHLWQMAQILLLPTWCMHKDGVKSNLVTNNVNEIGRNYFRASDVLLCWLDEKIASGECTENSDIDIVVCWKDTVQTPRLDELLSLHHNLIVKSATSEKKIPISCDPTNLSDSESYSTIDSVNKNGTTITTICFANHVMNLYHFTKKEIRGFFDSPHPIEKQFTTSIFPLYDTLSIFPSRTDSERWKDFFTDG
jgi:hypothetical protein